MITMQEMRVLEEKLTFFHSSFHFRIHTSKQVSMESVTVMQIDFWCKVLVLLFANYNNISVDEGRTVWRFYWASGRVA